MSCFHNILVGVDLSQYDPATGRPGAVAREVVDRALSLGGKDLARLTFCAALNVTPEALHHLDEADRSHVHRTVEEKARQILDGLVRQAQALEVDATSKLLLGPGWHELIRQVLREKHDLLLVGTRDRAGLERMLFGSTALKLLRRCPCPVWVAKPATGEPPLNVLVASDLLPVSDEVLGLVICLAHTVEMNIHLLHVVDYPLDHLWSTGLADAKTLEYHRTIRDAAEKKLREQLKRTDYRNLPSAVEMHVVEGGGVPDEAILKFIREHEVDLLAMGTIARSGLPGIMIGNTAERLLPEIPCSLLAVKPPGFQSPVTI